MTTYKRVKQILTNATKKYKANYQGHGNFWEELSIEEFEKVTIYGIQMIAPVTQSACVDMLEPKPEASSCCSPQEAPPETAKKLQGLKLMIPPPLPIHAGRGAASGLIKGLKGEFPFDKTVFQGENFTDGHFPRLPWGGEAVAEKDIQFISDWIDHGCPTDQPDPDSVDTSENQLTYNINLQLTDVYKPKLKQRKNVDNLTDDELYRLRCVFFELKKLNEWPRDRRSLYSWGKLHGNVCEHGWEQFLTWHRMFLYDFEQTLQDFDASVTIPYWDWTSPEYNEGKVPTTKAPAPKKGETYRKAPDQYPYNYTKPAISGVIPEAYRCWINDKALENLRIAADDAVAKAEKALKSATSLFKKTPLRARLAFAKNELKDWKEIIIKLHKIKNIKFNSGVEFFYMAGLDDKKENYYKYSPRIIAQLELINPLWYPLRYPNMFYQLDPNGNFVLKDGQPIPIKNGLQIPFHHHYPRAKDVQAILEVDNWRDFAGGPEYNQSFGVLDMAPHNTVHIWLGGYNKNYKEDNPNEPKTGDMLSNLTAGFDPIFWPHHIMIDRMFHKWQKKNPSLGPVNPNGTLAGLGYAVRDALSIERLGYEYVSVGHVFQVESPKGVSVLKSDYIKFDAQVYQSDKSEGKVELRFLEVIQAATSFVVRIFLNSPEADMFTPANKDNPNYAGSVFFWGHGNCVGGPGHCAPPPAEKRLNDLRPPNHNAKRNFIVDITKTVKTLAGKGVDKFQVNLIVVGPDGSDHENGFFPTAISLNEV